MAAEYFLYTTEYNNTLLERSGSTFAPLPPNTGEIFIDYFIPTNQPLYLYRESGGTIVVNDQDTINEYLEGTAPPPEPDDNVTQSQFTGYTAQTETQLSAITANTIVVVEDRVRWLNVWTGGTYQKNDMVRDGDWTMIANKETTDIPSPQPVGEAVSEFNNDDDAPFITQSEVSVQQIIVGQRYTTSDDIKGWLREVRFYSPVADDNVTYDIFAISNPTGSTPNTSNLGQFTFNRKGWFTIAAGDSLISPNNEFDIVAIIRNRGGQGSTIFNSIWQYKKSNGNPSDGEIFHQNNNREMRISYLDKDDNDFTTQLQTLEAGDEIAAGNIIWTITEIISQAGRLVVDVTPRSRINENDYNVTFTKYTPATIPYPEIEDQYSGGTVNGFLIINEAYPDDVVLDDNSYGIDVLFQPAEVSPDWDFVSSFGDGSSSGGVGITYWGSIDGDISNQIDLQENFVNVSGDTITGDLKINQSLYITGTSATTQQLENSVLLGAMTSDGKVVATNTPALNVSEEITDITGNTVIENLSGIYYVDTTVGDITVELPDASPENDVSRLSIIKKTADANIVIVTTTGGTQNIGSATSQSIGQQDKGISIISDADNNKWLILQDSRFPDGQDEGTLLSWNNINKVWRSTTNDVTWNASALTLTVGGNSTPPTVQIDASEDILLINAESLSGLTGTDNLGFYAGGRGAFGNSVTLDRLRSGTPSNQPRSLSLIDTNSTVRIWRYVNDGNDPAVEFVWGLDDDITSPNNNWWDMFLDGGTGGTDTFAIRRRTEGISDKILTVSTSGISTPYTISANEKYNLFTGYTNSNIKTGDLWYNGEESLFFRTSGNTYDLLNNPTALTAVQIRRTTDFTVPTTWGDVTFGTIDVESDAIILSADTVNTDRIIALQDGLYQITYDGVVNAGGQFRMRINDSTVIAGSSKNIFTTVTGLAATDTNADVSDTVLVELNANDYVTLQVQEDPTAGAANLLSGVTLKVTKLDSAKGTMGPKGDKGETGSGSSILVKNNDVNPNPTGGTYTIINISSGLTATDRGDGETVDIIYTGITESPIKNKFQAIDSVGGQALNDVTPNPIEWGVIEIQDTSVFTFTTGNSNVTVLKDGWYEISYNVNGAGGNNRSIVGIDYRRNSTSINPTLTASYVRNTSNNDSSNTLPPYLIQLNANDILDVAAFRLGDSTAVTSKANQSFIRINYLG